MKYINDSTPAQRLAVRVVLNKKGQHVATVQTLYPSDRAGRLVVNVWQGKAGIDACGGDWDTWRFQEGKASGYGCDKETAALAGLKIAGHMLADDCGQVPECEAKRARIMARYKAGHIPQDMAEAQLRKIGARFANWHDGRFTSAHFLAGLDRLEALGFTVIRGI